MAEAQEEKKLVLLDGHALAYRAYHALPANLATSKGELTNAVYGFTSMLLNVLSEEKPDYIAVAFDVGETFRHEEFEEYKAHRGQMPDELRTQMDRIRQIIQAFNIPIFEVEGYEADDVLGALADEAQTASVETLIVSGDTDVFQLIKPGIRVLTSRRQFSNTIIYDVEKVRDRYGLRPEQLADYKALKGDTSDNIPGISGIGTKTATALLQQFDTVEDIVQHLSEIDNTRARRALEGKVEQALLGKKLATIVTDVPVKLDLAECQIQEFDRERIMELFRELEFKSLVDRLPEGMDGEVGDSPPEFVPAKVVDTVEALADLADRLRDTNDFAFDVETTAIDSMAADLVGIALALNGEDAYYIPVQHPPRPSQQSTKRVQEQLGLGIDFQERDGQNGNLSLQNINDQLKAALRDTAARKYAHNAKYDCTVLKRHGSPVAEPLFDTMIAAYLLEPSSRHLNLKDLAWARLGVEMQPISDLIGKGKDQITMAEVEVAAAARYAAADVQATYRLADILEEELREKQLWDLFQEVEMPLVQILSEMEMTGIALDKEYLNAMSDFLHGQLEEIENGIYSLAGHQFNVNSTQQLGKVLFEELDLPVIRRTKTGYSTAADVLEKLQGRHDIIDLILQQRHLSKLKSTYVDALPELVNPETGRLHTSYNQTGTVTGRISSSDPNLQNIPIRSELGRKIRKAFVAEESSRLLAADYSQVELRVLAHMTEDPGLADAFRRGEDIHSSTAATLFDVPLEQVTPSMRRLAKTTNFGIIYGISGYGLAQRTEFSPEEADDFIIEYFEKYPKVEKYMERTKKQASEQGYVETLLGRRRYFPALKEGSGAHYNVRSRAEREAINMPIQGTAADIIKLAMISLNKALNQGDYRGRMILQVHDELILEVPEEELEEVAPLVRSVMQDAFELDVPLKVDLKAGENWQEMEEVNAKGDERPSAHD